MTDLGAYLAASVFLAFAAHRLVITRGEAADPAQRYVAGFAICLGAAIALNARATLGALVRRVPLRGADVVLTHELKTAGLTFLVLLALALAPPDARRSSLRLRRLRQVGLAVAVQAGSAGLFLAADPTVDERRDMVLAVRGSALAAYNAIFALYGCWCLLALVRALARHTRDTAPGLLRTGLRLMMLAAALGAAWTLWAFKDVATDVASGQQGLGEDPVSVVLGGVTALLATGGATTSLWGDRLTALPRWLRTRRAYHRLEPLWTELHCLFPEIALAPSGAVWLRSPQQAEFALYRRVIEIRDGHMALRPYREPGLVDQVRRMLGGVPETGPAAARHAAVVEAAVMAAALENKRAGRRCDTEAPPDPPTAPPARTVDAEADWLLSVTAAFTRSPVVAGVRGRARARAVVRAAAD